MKLISFVIQEKRTTEARWIDCEDFENLTKKIGLDKLFLYRDSYPGRRYQLVRRVTTHEDTAVKG